VHRAVHEASGREVALKVVRAPSHRRRARIEREATLAARLRHPNIVAIHDCGALADGRYAIALELVDGAPLNEWSRELGSRMSPTAARAERLRVFVRICDAIEHAHRHGVIHCDIKPDNILVDREGEPRVLDFGVARAAERDEGASITVTGELACTLAYASPEQLAGNRGAIDTRTDIYSLGVVLYELLTGTLPHAPEEGISALVASISRSPPPAPSGAVRDANEPRIDRDLDTIALTALAKDPDRRYPTAAALKADLLHFLRGEPIAARRDSIAYVLRKAIVRHRRGVAVGTIALLAALIGTAATVIATVQARESRLREESERARLRIEAQRRRTAKRLRGASHDRPDEPLARVGHLRRRSRGSRSRAHRDRRCARRSGRGAPCRGRVPPGRATSPGARTVARFLSRDGRGAIGASPPAPRIAR
jgi:hypothetical protein